MSQPSDAGQLQHSNACAWIAGHDDVPAAGVENGRRVDRDIVEFNVVRNSRPRHNRAVFGRDLSIVYFQPTHVGLPDVRPCYHPVVVLVDQERMHRLA